MRLLPALVLATATAATSLAAAGQAEAGNTIRLFKVTAEGSGTFATHQTIPNLPGLPHEISNAAQFTWKTELPTLGFGPDGAAMLVGGAGGAVKGTLSGKATQETLLRGLDGKGNVVVTRGTCTAAQQSQKLASAQVVPGGMGEEHGETGTYLTVSPYPRPAFAATCQGDMFPPTSQLTVESAAAALEQRFFLPRDATRMGKIIQLVTASPAQKDNCAPMDFLDSCSLDWSGKLTFEFAGYLDKVEDPAPVDEDDIPMPPAPKPAEPDDLDDIVIPLPGTAKLGKGGKSASVQLECAAGCAGTVKAFPARGAKASAAARTPLATKRFTAPAGKRVTVRLRFRGKARRAVRRAGAVRLVATAGGDRHVVVAR